jgi:hypothetical protein
MYRMECVQSVYHPLADDSMWVLCTPLQCRFQSNFWIGKLLPSSILPTLIFANIDRISFANNFCRSLPILWLKICQYVPFTFYFGDILNLISLYAHDLGDLYDQITNPRSTEDAVCDLDNPIMTPGQ